MSHATVCYFGAYQPDYPRNLILRRGLEAQGITVIECRVDPKLSTRERARALRTNFGPIADQCEVILVSEFSAALTPAAWKLAKQYKKKCVVDAFTPLYDSAIRDRQTRSGMSLSALRYWGLDWLSVNLPSLVLVDTEQHAAYFSQTFKVKRKKIKVIPVGASQEWFESPAKANEDQEAILVQFYGTYIPLHGIDTILRSADLLRENERIRFELIGRGQTFPDMKALADSLNLTNVTFTESVASSHLPEFVSKADISLGIFGTTGKASRVVPNKVYQTLAMGKPVITADTPAIRSSFTPDEHLITVRPGNAEALAEAIIQMVENPDRRRSLGEAGRQKMESTYTESHLGAILAEVLGSWL